MKEIKVKDIIKICNGKLIYGNDEIVCEDFSRDTREIKKNDTYIGIKGEKFDGSLFYKEALEKGASVCILQNEETLDKKVLEQYQNIAIVIVENTIKALQQIATYKRSLYNIPVIAVTGSVGKTSTKDIIASVMSKKYNVLKTEGNLNNHIGLPLTILRLKEHTAMVVEMGMNALGEIRTLTNIAKPTIAVITNIGTSHIGELGSRENILKAKLEILEGMDKNGTVIVNNDNDLLSRWKEKSEYKTITYGIENQSNIMADNINYKENESTFEVKIEENKYKVTVPIGGKHFVYNSLCAICVGLENKIEIEKIIEGIAIFKLTKNRMEVVKNKNGVTIINDTYNASYDSMKSSLEYMKSLKGRKIAVLGDMLELGEFSKELHEKVGIDVKYNNVDILIVCGKEAKNISRRAIEVGMNKNNVFEYDEKKDVIEKLKNTMKNGDIILLKASNGMKFNEIVKEIITVQSK